MTSVSSQRNCAVCFGDKTLGMFVPYEVKGDPTHHKGHACWIDVQCLLKYIDAQSRLDRNAICPLCNKEITLVGGIPLFLVRATLKRFRPYDPVLLEGITSCTSATPGLARIHFARVCVSIARIVCSRIDFGASFGIHRARIAVERACVALERVIAAPGLSHANLDSALADLNYASGALERALIAFHGAPVDAGHIYIPLVQKTYIALGALAISHCASFALAAIDRTSTDSAVGETDGIFSKHTSLYFFGMGILFFTLFRLARMLKE